MSINLNASATFALNCGNGWLNLTTCSSDSGELAVYLVTFIRGTPVSCLLIIEDPSIWPYYMKPV